MENHQEWSRDDTVRFLESWDVASGYDTTWQGGPPPDGLTGPGNNVVGMARAAQDWFASTAGWDGWGQDSSRNLKTSGQDFIFATSGFYPGVSANLLKYFRFEPGGDEHSGELLSRTVQSDTEAANVVGAILARAKHDNGAASNSWPGPRREAYAEWDDINSFGAPTFFVRVVKQ